MMILEQFLIFTRLDDIQDNSAMRRGSPATHIIFGMAQTINSATYIYARCFEKVSGLSKGAVTGFLCMSLQNEHIH
jgi:geranylgeranyl pyrophosphate synthase